MRFIHPVLLALSVAFSSGQSSAVEKQTIEAKGGQVEIPNLQHGVARLIGLWKFSTSHLDTIDDKTFAKLPEKDALKGNIHYLFFTDLPQEGSLILKIDSLTDQNIIASTDALLTTAQFRLVNEKSSILFEAPNFQKKGIEDTRQQIPDFSFSLPIRKGANYLIYNYKQEPFQKTDGVYSNAGLGGRFLIGDPKLIHDQNTFTSIFLQVPLGVFLCLSIYSLLIYFSRGREDIDSLHLFLFNFITFLKEFGSQNIVTKLFAFTSFSLDLSMISFAGPMLATAVSVKILHQKVPGRFLNILFWITLVNGATCVFASLLLAHATFLPMTSMLSPIFVLVNAACFFLLFIPYTLITAIRNRNTEIVLFTIGILALGAGTLSDFFNIALALDWPWLAMWGGMVLSVLLAKNNSLLFAQAFNRAKTLNIELEEKNEQVQDLNRGLEEKVKERTKEIKALLEYIPQGVLSIGEDGFIEGNYSSQLPDVLGHENIAGNISTAITP